MSRFITRYSFGFIIITSFVLPACTNDVDPYAEARIIKVVDQPTKGSDATFEQYFKLVQRIHLSDEITIGDIGEIDIDDEGRLLVEDNVGRNILLYDGEGRLLKKLSPEACTPGYHWRPTKAKFSPDGTVLVLNAGPWGYRFKKNGDCLGPMDDQFMPPFAFDFDSDGNIYGYFKENGYYIKKIDPNGKELSRFGEGTHFANIVRHTGAPGLVCDRKGSIYLALQYSPYIYKFSESGKPTGKIGWIPSYYRQYERDVPYSEDIRILMEMVHKEQENSTSTIKILMLDKNKLLVLHFNDYKRKVKPNEIIGVAVMDLEGNSLMKEELQGGREVWFDAAKNGLVYRVEISSDDGTEMIKNPTLNVYRFVGE